MSSLVFRYRSGIVSLRGIVSPWFWLNTFMALLVLVPLGTIFSFLLQSPDDVWRHIVDHLLGRVLWNTLWLVIGVGVGTLALGVSLAWLTTVCDFPGRRFFEWALVLPLAIPVYVTAFVFIGLLDFSGPVQTLLRAWFGEGGLWIPPIRSAGGVIVVMSLALFPYVYLFARNAFASQGKRVMEVSRSLGYGPWGSFLHGALPLARPWIIGGLALVLMEALADFGAVSIFNYETFTTAIYKSWFSMFSLSTAARLSALLVLAVFVLLFAEQLSRRRMRYAQGMGALPSDERIHLTGTRAWGAAGYALLVLAIAFLIPVGQLVHWVVGEVLQQDLDRRYWTFLWHSLFLSVTASVITALAGMLLVFTGRLRQGLLNGLLIRIATLGYALPGAVLAVGVFIPLAWLAGRAIEWSRDLFGLEIGWFLNTTPLVLMLAYLVRFLMPAHGAVDSAMKRITPGLDEAARNLGLKGLPLFGRVYLPLLRGGVMTALVIVFVEVLKEMPITLMTRPFGWDTLAVQIFELTSEGEWERAALPALVLVLTGLLPAFLLIRSRGDGLSA